MFITPPVRGRTSRRGAARSRGPPPWRAGGRGGEPERRGDGRLIMLMIVMMTMEDGGLAAQQINKIIGLLYETSELEHVVENHVNRFIVFAEKSI